MYAGLGVPLAGELGPGFKFNKGVCLGFGVILELYEGLLGSLFSEVIYTVGRRVGYMGAKPGLRFGFLSMGIVPLK